MSIFIRIAGLTVAAALGLWCLTIAIHSFTPQAGAGLPRLAGGVGLQTLLGIGALVTLGLVVSGTVALTRSPGPEGQPLWLIASLAGWCAAAAFVASSASSIFLAPVDLELGVGPDVASSVAHDWSSWFWMVSAACAASAALLVVRRIAVTRHGAEAEGSNGSYTAGT